MPLFVYTLLYNIFLKLYSFFAFVLSFKQLKAKQFIDGRKNIFVNLSKELNTITQQKIWIHCASLGEFEQVKPIIEYLYNENKYYILISFFSPSGYEVSKNYPFAHAIYYLPIDSKSNANKWLQTIKPSLIVFVKYEFWYYYLTKAKQLKIPIILVSGIFRANQPFFKWYNKLHVNMLQCFNYILVQNNASKELLNSIDINNVFITGDTRFDRVSEVAKNNYENELIKNFIDNKPCLISGSTWPKDEDALANFLNQNLNICAIIAPHQVDEISIKNCKQTFPNAVLFSNLLKNQIYDIKKTNILIIDCIGILSKVYRFANVCYVGGGFGKEGVHNVLEAGIYGKPVVFGPYYSKFIEAKELIEADGAISVKDKNELKICLNDLFNNPSKANSMGENSLSFTQHKTGATQKTITIMKKYL